MPSFCPFEVWIEIIRQFCAYEDASSFCLAFPHFSRRVHNHLDKVTVRGCSSLAAFRSWGLHLGKLSSLEFEFCQPEALCASLELTLEGCRHLSRLVLRNCVLGKRELRLLHQCVLLNPRLQHVVLDPALTDDQRHEDIVELRKVLRAVHDKRLTHLTLTSMRSELLFWEGSSAAPLLQSFTPPAMGAPTLTHLSLTRIVPSSMVFADFLKALNRNKALESLELRHCRLQRVNFPPPAPLMLPRLKRLVLSHVQCSVPYVRACVLVPELLHQLSSLTLKYVHGSLDVLSLAEAVKWCGPLTNLVTLQIVRAEFKAASFVELMTVLQQTPALVHLTLGGLQTRAITSVFFSKCRAASFLPTLRTLVLRESCLDSWLLKTIAVLETRNPRVHCTWPESS